jgi:hypothetical protein
MPRSALLRVATLWAAVSLVGCSSRSYEADYQRRVSDFRGDSVFATLAPTPTDFLDGRVRLRLPSEHTTPNEDDGTKIRAKPPFVRDFPGYVGAFEKIVTVGNEQLPAVLTVGIVPTSLRRHAEVEKVILEQVRRDESFPKADWERGREVVATAGGPTTWDVLSLAGSQEFEIVVGGNPDYKKLPGRCEIWVSADPRQEFCTVVAYRVPDPLADQLPTGVPQTVELVARSVAIVDPPADPAADDPGAK